MEYRTLGRSGLNASIVGMGCWAIGGKWWGDDVSDRDSASAVSAALDCGINFFDTAPLYGLGHADAVLTEALGSRRHEAIIATKVGVRWQGDEHPRSELTPEFIRSDAEASLKRLKLDQIPLLQVHWPCELGTPLEATLEALVLLKEEGKIAHFGLCNYEAVEFREAVKLAPIETLQTPYSMVRRDFDQGLSFEVQAIESGVRPGVIAYEPLCRGLLSGKFDTIPSFPETDMRIRDDRFREPSFSRIKWLAEAVKIVARKVGMPPAAVAVAWVCRQRDMDMAIVGAKRPEQILESAQAPKLLRIERLWEALAPHVRACRP